VSSPAAKLLFKRPRQVTIELRFPESCGVSLEDFSQLQRIPTLKKFVFQNCKLQLQGGAWKDTVKGGEMGGLFSSCCAQNTHGLILVGLDAAGKVGIDYAHPWVCLQDVGECSKCISLLLRRRALKHSAMQV